MGQQFPPEEPSPPPEPPGAAAQDGDDLQKLPAAPAPAEEATPTTQQALAKILGAIKTMDSRLTMLESPGARAKDPEVVALEENVRERMDTLQLTQDGNSDDEWEPAGAGAPRLQRGKPNLQKSGVSKTAQDNCVYRQDWPQYHVFRGADREAATYDDLSIQEFVLGFLGVVNRAPQTPHLRDAMYRHLQELMLDATRYPWPSVRHYHSIVLHHMEIGEITWENTSAIQELRANYVSQAVNPPPVVHHVPMQAQPQAQSQATIRYCGLFQSGRCTTQGDHNSTRGFVTHCCAYCMRKGKGQFPHGEHDCRRKLSDEGKDPKNDA